LSLDGILAVDIVEGSFTTAKFARFIDGLLDHMNPYPGPNSVIIMDNCRIHKSNVILDMIRERLVFILSQSHSSSMNFIFSSGMRYEFLPPYSPDFNPIELAFSAVKAYIRRNGQAMRTAMSNKDNSADVFVLLNDAIWSITTDDAKGWFHHSGYL